MITLSAARPEIPTLMRRALVSLGVGAAVTALADWLFYMHPPGITVAIFALAIAVVVLLTNRIRASWLGLLAAAVILLLTLLPSVEDCGVLAVIFAIVGTALFALTVTGWPARSAVARISDVVWMALAGPITLVIDMVDCAHEAREHEMARRSGNWLKAWIVPLAVSGVFLALFAAANPVISSWFSGADTSRWADIDMARVAFWLLVLSLIWGFLEVRFDGTARLQDLMAVPPTMQPALPSVAAMSTEPPPRPPAAPGVLFGKTAILRSLVLFNAMFAVQTALDLTYLWGGAALPAGMTYASYAHRGVYPLIVTALLAGAFVLAAMRPGSETERSRPIRALIYLWIAQNVMLVISSIFRLALYVDVYSLTELRSTAFVGMLLVAVGLALIMARIAFDRSNAWLVWCNAAALALTLYVCSFVDFPGLIADFNVGHSEEMVRSSAGQAIDIGYLCDLGPAAIPAIDALNAKGDARLRLLHVGNLRCRDDLYGKFRARHADWRAFTLRSYRLERYLDQKAEKSPGAT